MSMPITKLPSRFFNFPLPRCRQVTSRPHSAAALWLVVFLPTIVAAGQQPAVTFDSPAIVVAEPVNPAVVEAPTTGGQLMRLRFAVSSRTSLEFRGHVNELVVEIENLQRTMRVLDFWPKSQVYSEIDGPIAVENQQYKDRNFAFQVSSGYIPMAQGHASGDVHHKQTVNQRYARKPPLQLLTTSGTLGRGYGVFYKFRSGPLPIADGGNEVALLMEVPSDWRAGMLQVTMRAVGTSSSGHSSSRLDELGAARLWMVVHQANDVEASEQAQRYVAQEQSLRALAEQNQKRIESRAYPTVFHKFGAALDVIDPRIPGDYLTQVLFGHGAAYFNEATNRLPVDLRVVILDYWDERNRLLGLSRTVQSSIITDKLPTLASAAHRISDRE